MPSPQANSIRLFEFYCNIRTKFATHSTYKRNVYFQNLKQHRKETKYSPQRRARQSHSRVHQTKPLRECRSSQKINNIYLYRETHAY